MDVSTDLLLDWMEKKTSEGCLIELKVPKQQLLKFSISLLNLETLQTIKTFESDTLWGAMKLAWEDGSKVKDV